jgi:hypothetical protein
MELTIGTFLQKTFNPDDRSCFGIACYLMNSALGVS